MLLLKFKGFATGSNIPDLYFSAHQLVTGGNTCGGGYQLSIRAERQAVDMFTVVPISEYGGSVVGSLQMRRDWLTIAFEAGSGTGLQVPDPHGALGAGGCKALAVRTEIEIDRALELTQKFTGNCAPYLDILGISGGNASPVAADRHLVDDSIGPLVDRPRFIAFPLGVHDQDLSALIRKGDAGIRT